MLAQLGVAAHVETCRPRRLEMRNSQLNDDLESLPKAYGCTRQTPFEYRISAVNDRGCDNDRSLAGESTVKPHGLVYGCLRQMGYLISYTSSYASTAGDS